MTDDDYVRKLEEQKAQYKTGAEIHDLPAIFHYWSRKHLTPTLEQVFGCGTVVQFYASTLADLTNRGPAAATFVSIGSGDAALEIDICKALLASQRSNFHLVCTDVNEHLLEEANVRISQNDLSEFISTRCLDLNRPKFDCAVSAFIAHHSLHHIVELEQLFDLIDQCLIPDGRFATIDMIGRNGHMRWPETLGFVEALWRSLPDEKKYNHQLKQLHLDFLNFDCSQHGFEGIRAQDILPLLVDRFRFDAFHATGGITDVFVDRGYGPNYSVQDPWDLEFIDFVEAANEQLLDLGLIKPTMMFAKMSKKGVHGSPRMFRKRTPEFCVRRP